MNNYKKAKGKKVKKKNKAGYTTNRCNNYWAGTVWVATCLFSGHLQYFDHFKPRIWTIFSQTWHGWTYGPLIPSNGPLILSNGPLILSYRDA